MNSNANSNTLTKLDSLITKVSGWFGFISGLLSMLITILITLDICGRFFIGTVIPGTLAISRLTLAWICFLGITYAFTNDSHVRVTFFVKKLNPKVRAAFDAIACAGALLLFALLAWKSSSYFWISWVNREWFAAPIPIPYWLAKMSIPIGAYLFSAAAIVKLLVNLQKLFVKSEGEL